jgi:hypothetical protein
MGPRSVERPVTVAGGSSRRDGGALGNDMDRTRNGRGDDRRIFSESSFRDTVTIRLITTRPYIKSVQWFKRLLETLFLSFWDGHTFCAGRYRSILRYFGVEPLLKPGNPELPKKVRKGTQRGFRPAERNLCSQVPVYV